MAYQFDKDPIEDLDYGFDLVKWLNEGESVTQLEVTVDPAASVDLHDPSATPQVAVVWAAGGILGARPRLEFTITTDSNPPRVFKRSIHLFIRRR